MRTDGEVIVGVKLDTKSFDYQIENTEKELNALVNSYDKAMNKSGRLKPNEQAMAGLRERIEITNNKLTDLKIKQDLVNNQGYEKVSNSVNKVSQGHSNVLKKITKWGLAIFGVRSAYLGIRRVVSSVLSQNKGLGDQMSAMGKSFANAFAPAVEKIINLLRTLMAYINYVWQRLFGKNLFSDKVKKDLKSGEKSAKEIRNQLANFDEANVLSDNKTKSDEGITDIGLANVKIPDWLVKLMDWVKENPKLAGILFGTTVFTLFGGFKIAGGLFNAIDKLLGGGAGAGATGLLGILGTMILIAGTVIICKVTYDQVKDAIKYYKDLIGYQKQVNDETIEISTANMKTANSFVKNNEGIKASTESLKVYRAWIKNTISTNSQLIDSENLSENAKIQLRNENYHLIQSYEQLYKQGSLTADEEYEYYKFLKNVFPLGIDATNKKLEGTKTIFDNLNKKYETQYNIDIKQTGAKDVSNAINNAKNSVEQLTNKWETFIKKVTGNINISLSTAKHATGGIVNLPGRGVPVNHVAGEAGREGIIPMDNESQMQLLGQTIAKYVNINNIVNNYMDARKINSILQESANEQRLANNNI